MQAEGSTWNPAVKCRECTSEAVEPPRGDRKGLYIKSPRKRLTLAGREGYDEGQYLMFVKRGEVIRAHEPENKKKDKNGFPCGLGGREPSWGGGDPKVRNFRQGGGPDYPLPDRSKRLPQHAREKNLDFG